MEEVDVLAVDLGGELGVVVEVFLVGAPVVVVAPVVGEFLEVGARDAVLPVGAGELVWPAGVVEAVVEVVEVGLGDGEVEGLDVGHGGDVTSDW